MKEGARMLSTRIAGLSLIAAVTCGIGWAYAQQKTSRPTLTVEDYLEIQQLYARYSQTHRFGRTRRRGVGGDVHA